MAEWLRPGAIATDSTTWGTYYPTDSRTLVASTAGAAGWADDLDATGHLSRGWRDGSNADHTTAAVAAWSPFTLAGLTDLRMELRVTVQGEPGGTAAPWLEVAMFDPEASPSALDFATYGPGGGVAIPSGTSWLVYEEPEWAFPDVAARGLAVGLTVWNQLASADPFEVFIHEARLWGNPLGGRRGLPRARRYPRGD